MSVSRRGLLGGLAVGGLAVGGCKAGAEQTITEPTITDKIKSAEGLAGVTYTDAEREQMASVMEGFAANLAPLRNFEKPNSLAPATVFDPRLPGVEYPAQNNQIDLTPVLPRMDRGAPTESNYAFMSVADLSGLIRSKRLSSERLTKIYLDRIAKHDPALEAFITVMGDSALKEARRADAEIKAGQYRGALHGIPYAAKDLLDTAGVKTTFGAEPFKDRVPETDATVITKLREAGAVLLGKTSLGALAYGDIWFGGVTKNPWNTAEGSSGSSAGSCSATAAGLCAFAIGSETLGSLISPSTRCGTTALRPTFGRVSRAGAMALCWSMDKLGPVTRYAEDTALVLEALNGYDAADAGSIDMGFSYNGLERLPDITLGYDPAWFDGADAGNQKVLETLRDMKAKGITVKELSEPLPDLPYGALLNILLSEAAAAFEMLTLDGRDDLLKWQDDNAWPNTFRQARFISAIDLIQSDRIRRLAMEAMHKVFADVDVLISPPFAGGLLQVTNYTGHPALVMRSGFTDMKSRTLLGNQQDADAKTANVPTSTVLWGKLFDDGRLVRVARDLELVLNVAAKRPDGFN